MDEDKKESEELALEIKEKGDASTQKDLSTFAINDTKELTTLNHLTNWWPRAEKGLWGFLSGLVVFGPTLYFDWLSNWWVLVIVIVCIVGTLGSGGFLFWARSYLSEHSPPGKFFSHIGGILESIRHHNSALNTLDKVMAAEEALRHNDKATAEYFRRAVKFFQEKQLNSQRILEFLKELGGTTDADLDELAEYLASMDGQNGSDLNLDQVFGEMMEKLISHQEAQQVLQRLPPPKQSES